MQKLEIQQKQVLKMNQQLKQSLKVLSLVGGEMVEFVEQEMLENPLLERVESPYTESFESNWMSGTVSRGERNSDFSALSIVSSEKSIEQQLLEQFNLSVHEWAEVKIAEYILGSLDDSGFLSLSVEDIAGDLNFPPEYVERVRKQIMNLENGGFAARGPIDYLLWQLEQKNGELPQVALAKEILQQFLSELTSGDMVLLAEATAQSVSAVKVAVELIRGLTPRPANTLIVEKVAHIVPDVIFFKTPDGFSIALNPYYYPRLIIMDNYLENSVLDKQTNRYIKTKKRAANFLNYCLVQREETMRKIAELILRLQGEFFEQGLLHMQPLQLRDIAEKMNVHVSTVCRAISNKYAQTPYGVMPMKKFFPSAVKTTQGAVTPAYVKKQMVEVIKKLGKKTSDRLIAETLQAYGISIARRTVAKYRTELGLKK